LYNIDFNYNKTSLGLTLVLQNLETRQDGGSSMMRFEVLGLKRGGYFEIFNSYVEESF
jgi:hypothetical protein